MTSGSRSCGGTPAAEHVRSRRRDHGREEEAATKGSGRRSRSRRSRIGAFRLVFGKNLTLSLGNLKKITKLGSCAYEPERTRGL
ncbi:hypothetical protein LOK49_LG11G02058 [Camellia lanceoleosa]|uniref:Uncharacterized protein n=1 Tax=Camellia lanceoleosa TaxID=1840588 RepID=A0ACC0G637_9ERIC|nr:hypothetical protein LOK49_LG11G02058 [Camellia lanceoleosa]